ncbi:MULTISPECIES: JAB domain-containing protein [Pantoea]|jgi:DNA repair protein RadC|uniref:JAB domain-containing protein n=1 Tax=Pantoea TaxID=53335 RepID=UPI00177DB6FB|nr:MULTISPECIES: JAB domain-containing protein [Pantoea]MBD8197606.1 DNA repair protein RadC [Pantoea agglomerans]
MNANGRDNISQQNVNTPASEFEESSLHTVSDDVRILSRLPVLNAQGNYAMATYSQILAEAELAINYRYLTDTVFSEVLAVAYLNNQHQMLAYEEIFYGSILSVEIHPREIVRRALQHNVSAVILGHNHPSFLTEPSRVDINLTSRLREVLEGVSVRVIYHLIMAGNKGTF